MGTGQMAKFWEFARVVMSEKYIGDREGIKTRFGAKFYYL